MVSRYDAAKHMSENWPLLNWKGDEHTKGVYFNDGHGYMIERTYAVRVKHSEPAPPVFYIPSNDLDEEEVLTDYPYTNMMKQTKKYHLLFQGCSLERALLDDLFDIEANQHAMLPANELIDLLQSIPNKRDRDRSHMLLTITGNDLEASLVEGKKKEPLASINFGIIDDNACNSAEIRSKLKVNANTLLHALSLFYTKGHVHFSIGHDRIKLTSYASTLKVEAVISLLK